VLSLQLLDHEQHQLETPRGTVMLEILSAAMWVAVLVVLLVFVLAKK
jgi:hypothetical protein